MPPMVAISGSIICSQEVKGFDYSLKAGVEIGQVFGELDFRSSIDLPMVYHRLGVFFNGWGVYGGVDIQRKILKNTNKSSKKLIKIELSDLTQQNIGTFELTLVLIDSDQTESTQT